MPRVGPVTRSADVVETSLDERLRAGYPALRQFAAVVGHSATDPDDLVQDAVVGLLGQTTAPYDLEAYLRRSILNIAIDRRRRHDRWQRRVPRLLASGTHLDAYPSDLAILDQLSPKMLAVVWLVDIEGATYAEAGATVGVSEAAARKQASRARRRLRSTLAIEELP